MEEVYMKKKIALVSFLAVFMLLAVSFASAGTYTVRPALDNIDIEEQVTTEVEQIPTVDPASILFWGKATLNVHAEVIDYSHGFPASRYPVNGGHVRATPFIFPLWLRFLLTITGTTDSNGECQLQVLAPPKWLGISIFYRVWVSDPRFSGFDGCGLAGRSVYAGGSYTVYIEIKIPFRPENNAEQTAVLAETELVSQQSSISQQFSSSSSISGQSNNR